MLLCEVCGNEIDGLAVTCPYCGTAGVRAIPPTAANLHKTVNLERGLPTAVEALRRLAAELDTARREGCRVLTLIHGYGSSGKGGVLRQALRAQLGYLLDRREINLLIPGELFGKRHGPARELLKRFPAMARHADFDRKNRGITIVVP